MVLLVGFCNEKDLDAIRNLYEQAFDDSLDFVDYYFSHKIVPNRVVGLKQDEKLISMAHLNPFEVTFAKLKYPVSYFVAVATHKDEQGKGYMGKVMKYALQALYEKGEAFSLLMPIDSRIYERYGFGFIEDHLDINSLTGTWTIEYKKPEYKIATKDDAEQLFMQYSNYCKRFNLFNCRSEEEFLRLFLELEADDAKTLLFQDGYVITYFENEQLHVREIVALSEKSLMEILSYLKDAAERVIIHDHVLSDVKQYVPNISENQIVLKQFMMARVIDAKQFIQKNISLFCENVGIRLIDPVIEDNNKVFVIKDGELIVETNGKYDIELDIKTFTQCVFGYMDMEQLMWKKKMKCEVFKEFMISQTKRPNYFNEYV